VEREVRGLLQEAESALQGSAGLAGDPLLGQLDRVLAVSARIQQLSPDHEGVGGIRDRALAARERAIAERERLARRRQLARVGVLGLALAAVSAVAVTLMLDARRRETLAALERESAARKEAADERDAKGRALAEVLRLSDSKRVGDLLAEEDSLWPVHPDVAPAMDAWLERARAVLGNRTDHEAALARVRERAEPYTDAERARDHASATERLSAVKAQLTAPDDPKADEAKRAEIAERRAALEEESRRLAAEIAERGSWRFAEPEDDWRHQVLVDLLQGIDRLTASVDNVRRRHDAVQLVVRKVQCPVRQVAPLDTLPD